MIVRITGNLTEIGEARAVLDRDGLAYEIMVCGSAREALEEQRGREVTLYTLHYLEGSATGGNLTPRLVGFLTPEERAFFELFITVKNMGTRKALKALVQPACEVAAAIESGDARALAALPGIGRRMADQIIAELKGKVEVFAIGAARPHTQETAGPRPAELDDALQVMVALGEKRVEAERWLDQAVARHPGRRGADEWVRLAYRIRSGLEG